MQIELDGRAVFAATGGQPVRPDHPAALFLHGAGMDHSVWTLPARYVAHHGGAVLVPDLPGHAKSAGPALGSIADMAQWSLRLLDAQKLERAAIVGDEAVRCAGGQRAGDDAGPVGRGQHGVLALPMTGAEPQREQRPAREQDVNAGA